MAQGTWCWEWGETLEKGVASSGHGLATSQ